MPSVLKKNLPLVLGALAILVAVAAYLTLRPKPVEDVTVLDSGPGSVAQSTFLTLVAELDPISFNTGVLVDTRFLSLVDLRTAIIPETPGRTDPFGPL